MKIKKIDLTPTKDLKDKLIVFYPYNTKISDLPLTRDEMVKLIFTEVFKKQTAKRPNLGEVGNS